jgi:hypothetical protein
LTSKSAQELVNADQLEDGPRVGLDGKTRKLPEQSEKDEDAADIMARTPQ